LEVSGLIRELGTTEAKSIEKPPDSFTSNNTAQQPKSFSQNNTISPENTSATDDMSW
jgi:hypothetical protein